MNRISTHLKGCRSTVSRGSPCSSVTPARGLSNERSILCGFPFRQGRAVELGWIVSRTAALSRSRTRGLTAVVLNEKASKGEDARPVMAKSTPAQPAGGNRVDNQDGKRSGHHVIVDRHGNPLVVSLTGGNRHDVTACCGRGRDRPVRARSDPPLKARAYEPSTATFISSNPVPAVSRAMSRATAAHPATVHPKPAPTGHSAAQILSASTSRQAALIRRTNRMPASAIRSLTACAPEAGTNGQIGAGACVDGKLCSAGDSGCAGHTRSKPRRWLVSPKWTASRSTGDSCLGPCAPSYSCREC